MTSALPSYSKGQFGCESNLHGLIGQTPLVDCSALLPAVKAAVHFKLEKFNAAGSVKDRAAAHIVRQAANSGRLASGGTIVESSSGNFGIALSFVAAILKYRVIIIVDPNASPQNIAIMRAYGAEVIVEREVDETGNYHLTRVRRARELEESIPGAYWVNQTENDWNVEAHRLTTAQELIQQTNGEMSFCVLPISSGGQVSGVAEGIKAACPGVRIVAVDVDGSGIFSPERHAYRTPGMGLSWRPKILREGLIDHVFLVTDAEACSCARFLARNGLLVGPSSGATALVCYHLALQHEIHKKVVGVLADGGERYLTTVFDDEWCTRNGMLVQHCKNAIRETAENLRPHNNWRPTTQYAPELIRH